MTIKTFLKIAVRLVFLIVSVIVVIEISLFLLDPWGLKYFDDLATVWDSVVAHPVRKYILPPRQYQFSNWSALELDNSIRNTPGNANGPCKVVFLGDSMTWGHGVNDKDTWVNLIASQLPQINAINAGLDGYNSEHVRRTMSEFPDANVFVYFIVGNDAEPTSGSWPRQPHLSMIEKYIRYIALSRGIAPDASRILSPGTDTERFNNDLQFMNQDSRVVLIGFDEDFTKSLRERFSIHLVPLVRHRISYADPHPNPLGHRELADAILPAIRAAIERQCPSAK